MSQAQSSKNVRVTQPDVRCVHYLHDQHGLNVPEPA
jgi:hypothetical protein